MGRVAAKPLNIVERRSIEKYNKLGWSCSQIAQVIGRSKNAVVTEIRRGGKKKYTAQEGQRLADEILAKKKQHLRSLNEGTKAPIFKYKERIENLEMQIEILHDTIKELLK